MMGNVIGTDTVDLSFRILDTNQNSHSALWFGRGDPRNILSTQVREYSFKPSNKSLASFKSIFPIVPTLRCGVGGNRGRGSPDGLLDGHPAAHIPRSCRDRARQHTTRQSGGGIGKGVWLGLVPSRPGEAIGSEMNKHVDWEREGVEVFPNPFQSRRLPSTAFAKNLENYENRKPEKSCSKSLERWEVPEARGMKSDRAYRRQD